MTSQAHSSARFIASFFLLTACADLSPIEDNVCGNNVTEALNHEECDGESDCFAASTTFQCRYKCIVDGDGGRSCREPGYKCGLDDVCRAPSGQFEFVAEITGSPTVGLGRADFDADGRLDVLRESHNESFVQFYGEGFSVASSQNIVRIPNLVAPLLGRLNDDELSDVAFSYDAPQSSGMVVYRTRTDGSLDSTIYPTIPVPAAPSPKMSAIGVIANFSGDESEHEIIGFVGNELESSMFGLDNLEIVPLPAPPQLIAPSLAGLVVGDFDPSLPCEEVAFTQDLSTTLWIIRPCGADGLFTTQPSFTELSLPVGVYFADIDQRFIELTFDETIDPQDVLDPVKMHSALHVADINLDGRDDIVAVATDGSATLQSVPKYSMFVALQDASGSYPPVLALINPTVSLEPECNLEYPLGALLALGNFDADPTPDVVAESAIGLMSNVQVIDDGMGGPPLQVDVDIDIVECLEGHNWGRAVVDDFDANGTMDVVATRTAASYFFFDEYFVESIDGLDVRRGDGQGAFTSAAISTKQPVKLLQVGDFDGDLVRDIAYVETDTLAIDSDETEAADEVFALFGRTSGGFGTPQGLGQVRLARWMVAGRFEGGDATDDIGLVTRPERRRMALSPVLGSGSRQLVSPFVFSVATMDGPMFTTILGIVPGRFHDDAEVASFAVATRDIIGENQLGAIRLWRVSTSGTQAELDVDLLSAPPKADLNCEECVFAASDLDGDGLDELIAFGTSFGDMTGEASISIFEVAEAENTFALRGSPIDTLEPEPIPVWLTFSPSHFAGPLNTPVVRDFNGDGTADIAVIANTHELFEEFAIVADEGTPPFISGELVIFWNDQSGSLSLDRMSRLDAGAYEVLNTSVVQIDTDPEPELIVVVEARDTYGFSPGPDGGVAPELLPDIGEFGIKVLDFADGDLPTLASSEALNVSGATAFVEPEAVVAGDFDGDGVEDLLTGDQLGYIVLRGVPHEP